MARNCGDDSTLTLGALRPECRLLMKRDIRMGLGPAIRATQSFKETCEASVPKAREATR
jgi:hypothetical protein